MKRHDRKRLESDREIDRLLKTEEGRSDYWAGLAAGCQGDSMIDLLESTIHLPGDVIECGVFRGSSLQRICRVIVDRAPDKCVFACDSFEGFPGEEVGRVDVGFLRFLSRIRKKFRVCEDTPERLERIFAAFGVQGEIVRGYFSATLPRFNNSRFCFVHLDCDIYESYKTCLERLYQNLVPGGVVVFDDYKSPKWPGAEKAVDEFFSARPESVALCQERTKPAWYVRKPPGHDH